MSFYITRDSFHILCNGKTKMLEDYSDYIYLIYIESFPKNDSKLIFSGYPAIEAFPIEVSKGHLLYFEDLEIYFDDNAIAKGIKKNFVISVTNNSFSYVDGNNVLNQFHSDALIKGDIVSTFKR